MVDLNVDVKEQVRMKDAFGNSPELRKKIEELRKGIGGTLHLTNSEDKIKMVDTAWNLSRDTKKPVIIVVRA